jgi:hypothetical protein
MDPVTIGLGALALYALFARPARHSTPEEWAARSADKCSVDVDGYRRHLTASGISGSELEQLMGRIVSLRDSVLASCAQVQIETNGGAVDASTVLDSNDFSLFESDWCNPDEVEDAFGNCIPAGSASTNGIISRGMTGRPF